MAGFTEYCTKCVNNVCVCVCVCEGTYKLKLLLLEVALFQSSSAADEPGNPASPTALLSAPFPFFPPPVTPDTDNPRTGRLESELCGGRECEGGLIAEVELLRALVFRWLFSREMALVVSGSLGRLFTRDSCVCVLCARACV